MFATIEDMTLPERLKALRTKLDLTQDEMAARLKISRNYYWQLENGTKPGGPKLQRDIELIEQMPVSAPISVGHDIMRDVKLSQPRFVPLLTLAQAGLALVAWDSIPSDWYDKVPTDSSDPKAFAIEIRGDSMEPYIRQGDRLVMLPGNAPVNGDIVVARFRNGDTVLKLYHETEGGKTVHLASFNTEYPPATFRRSEFEAIVPADTLVKKMRPNLFQ